MVEQSLSSGKDKEGGVIKSIRSYCHHHAPKHLHTLPLPLKDDPDQLDKHEQPKLQASKKRKAQKRKSQKGSGLSLIVLGHQACHRSLFNDLDHKND